MLQHQHILLTLIFLLPFLEIDKVKYQPLDFLISLSIILIFSVLPDIDISGKKFVNAGFKLKKGIVKDYFTVLNDITNFIRIFIFIPYDIIIRIITGKKMTYHRESSHSIIFLFSSLIILLFIISILFTTLKLSLEVSLKHLFLAIMAFLTHLFLDSVTVNGINWFYPINLITIKGRLNTANNFNMRLIDFYIVFILLLFALVEIDKVIVFSDLPAWIRDFLNYIYPNHTYLLAIPLILFVREVKIF